MTVTTKSVRSFVINKPHQELELQQRSVAEPGAKEVRVKVQACGICHGDILSRLGTFPHINYPVVPGHEIAGVIDALGADVHDWKVGQRVGVGWYGGHCGQCANCQRGEFGSCAEAHVMGLTRDGGYAEYVIARRESLAAIPDALSIEDAAPLLCAGVTTYNALRHSHARAGDLVAIQGIGGLGHLGVQYAKHMGFNTVAIARGGEKKEFATTLGAHHYIDSESQNVSAELNKLGGAKVVLTTVTSSKAMSEAIDGLAVAGELMIVGASPESLKVSPLQLIPGRKTIRGWAGGTAMDSTDTLNFSVLCGIKPMIEKFALSDASEAYERMMSGNARFRVVLVP